MDFSKLNIEFSNLQSIVNKYNEIINIIKQKIKSNEKSISKLEIKINNTKNIIEKDINKLLLDSIKGENIFLNQLIKEEEIKK